MIAALLLACAMPSPLAIEPTTCDVIEVNTVWDVTPDGDLQVRFRQLILWDWTPAVGSGWRTTHLRARAWCMFNGSVMPHYGGWRVLMHNSDKLRDVRSLSFRQTDTLGWDPEVEDRKILPEKYRRGW